MIMLFFNKFLFWSKFFIVVLFIFVEGLVIKLVNIDEKYFVLLNDEMVENVVVCVEYVFVKFVIMIFFD